jgi:hypothetical protein
MNRFLSWLLLLPALWLGACEKGNVELDNSSDQTLRIAIDELRYSVGPNSFAKVELPTGPHRVTVRNEANEIIADTTIRIIEGGLINLAGGEYLIWTDLYGNPELRKTKLNEEWIDIGDQSYFGEFERVDPEQLYVEREWDYGLEEPFPKDLLGWEMTQEKWVIKRKLFREADLVDAYTSLVEEREQ